MKQLIIANKTIGLGAPCFVIAEAGINHNGNLSMALQLVDAALEAGADAVKFQTFHTEQVISPVAPKAHYQIETTGGEGSQLEMVKKLELSAEEFTTLYEYCVQKRILFLSTPFDFESVDLLDRLGMAAFKIPSGEITNLPFLEYVAKKEKPLIVSTGMATLEEVDTAVACLQQNGAQEYALLHCVSSYPALPREANLRAMLTMQAAFNVPVGFSDHTLGIDISLAAVALGASILEKHFTLDPTLPGPDHRSSLSPGELNRMISGIRTVEAALGDGIKRPTPLEMNTRDVARRSLTAAHPLSAGNEIAPADIAIRRPGTGLPPAMLTEILGRHLRVDVPDGALISLDMFD